LQSLGMQVTTLFLLGQRSFRERNSRHRHRVIR
jgi:hypothetical protein